MIDITQTIISLDATADVSVIGNDVNQITWHDNNPNNITNAQILAKQVELQTAYDALDYQRKRKAEYPSIEELVVALYDTEDKLALETKRQAVKLKYPKG
jgi:hypothetical protein